MEKTRKTVRKPIALKVKFRSKNLEEFVEKYATNISTGGIFIKTKKPLPVGTIIDLEIKLLEDEPLLKGKGEVVWRKEYAPGMKGQSGMGIKFVELEEESKKLLERVLTTKEEYEKLPKELPKMDSSDEISISTSIKLGKLESGGGAEGLVGFEDLVKELEMELGDELLPFISKEEKGEISSGEKMVVKSPPPPPKVALEGRTTPSAPIFTQIKEEKFEEKIEEREPFNVEKGINLEGAVERKEETKKKEIKVPSIEEGKIYRPQAPQIVEEGQKVNKFLLIGVGILFIFTVALGIFFVKVYTQKKISKSIEGIGNYVSNKKEEFLKPQKAKQQKLLQKNRKEEEETPKIEFYPKEIIIETEPLNVRVFINGKDFGKTPLTLTEDEFSFNEEELKIKLTTVGHDNWEGVLNLKTLEWRKEGEVLRYYFKVKMTPHKRKEKKEEEKSMEEQVKSQGEENNN